MEWGKPFSEDVLMQMMDFFDPSLNEKYEIFCFGKKKLSRSEWLKHEDLDCFLAIHSCELEFASMERSLNQHRENQIYLYNLKKKEKKRKKEEKILGANDFEREQTPPVEVEIPEPVIEIEKIEEEPEEELLFSSCSAWPGHHIRKDFVHHNGGQPLMLPDDFAGTLFDMRSVWDAEQLRDHLEESGGFDSIIVRNVKIPSDMDCIRWKVISNCPFVEPPQKEKEKRRRKKIKSR